MSQDTSILYWTPQSATSVAGEYRENGDKWTHGGDLVSDFICTYVCCPKMDACPTTSMYVRWRNLCTNTNCLTSCVKVAPNLHTLSLQRRGGVKVATYSNELHTHVKQTWVWGSLHWFHPKRQTGHSEPFHMNNSNRRITHRVLAFLSLFGLILVLLDALLQVLLLPFSILPGLLLPLELRPVGCTDTYVRTHTYHSWLVKP